LMTIGSSVAMKFRSEFSKSVRSLKSAGIRCASFPAS
jgi:hypothetical protein